MSQGGFLDGSQDAEQTRVRGDSPRPCIFGVFYYNLIDAKGRRTNAIWQLLGIMGGMM